MTFFKKMKPVYYAFFDDDVLYNIENVQSASLTEQNTQSFERIMSDTPYLRPFNSFIGVETQINRQDVYILEEMLTHPFVDEKLRFLLSPIGTNDETSKKSPAWEITLIQGNINSATKTLSSSYGYEQIPQIDSDITYKMRVKNENDYEENSRGRRTSPNVPISKTYPDGTYLDLQSDQVLLNILEKNGFNFNDSMEVEVYLADDVDPSKYKPLKFAKRQQSIVDGKLVDSPEQDIQIDDSYVEYYFDLRVDKEMPEDDICQGLERLKVKDIHLDLDVECVERDGYLVDIYGTRVTSIEDCD